MSNLTTTEKFSIVLGQTFDNMGIIIAELNQAGKTDLNAAMVDVLKQFILSHDKNYLINSFINSSYEYWDRIKEKDEKCLMNNFDKIFGDYTNKPEFASVKLIFSSHIDEEAKSFVWSCLSSLVKLSISHVFEERGGSVQKVPISDGKFTIKISYKNKDAYPKIDIPKCNKLWDLKLY